MLHGLHDVRVRQLVKSATAAFRVNDWPLNQIDPDGLRYVATISVRAQWFLIAILIFELVYRLTCPPISGPAVRLVSWTGKGGGDGKTQAQSGAVTQTRVSDKQVTAG